MQLRRWICWCLIAWSWTAVVAVHYRAEISWRRSSDVPVRPLRPSQVAAALAAVGGLYAFGLSRRGRAWLRLGSRLSEPARYGDVYLQTFTLRRVLLALWLLAYGWVLRLWLAANPHAMLSAFDWLDLVSYGLEAAAVCYAFVRCRSLRVPLAEWGWLPGRRAWREVVLGVLVGAVLVGLHQTRLFRAPAATLLGHRWPYVVSTVLWAPLIEETLCRGALYRYLRDRWQWPAAVAVSTVVFATMHLPVTRWPYAFVHGAVFALLREWRGTLFAACMAHAVLNLSTVLW